MSQVAKTRSSTEITKMFEAIDKKLKSVASKNDLDSVKTTKLCTKMPRLHHWRKNLILRGKFADPSG